MPRRPPEPQHAQASVVSTDLLVVMCKDSNQCNLPEPSLLLSWYLSNKNAKLASRVKGTSHITWFMHSRHFHKTHFSDSLPSQYLSKAHCMLSVMLKRFLTCQMEYIVLSFVDWSWCGYLSIWFPPVLIPILRRNWTCCGFCFRRHQPLTKINPPPSHRQLHHDEAWNQRVYLIMVMRYRGQNCSTVHIRVTPFSPKNNKDGAKLFISMNFTLFPHMASVSKRIILIWSQLTICDVIRFRGYLLLELVIWANAVGLLLL